MSTQTMAQESQLKPVDLPLSQYRVEMVLPEEGRLLRLVFRTLETFLGEPYFTRLSKKANEDRLAGEGYYSAYLRHNDVRTRPRGFPLSRLPKSGPVIFVANHPTGASDAAIVGSPVESHVRGDAKVLVARRFHNMPGWDVHGVPIDVPTPSGRVSDDDKEKLAQSRVDARQHLENGGSLIILPAGPGARKNEMGEFEEGDWRHGAFSLAAKTGARIVPVHVGAKRGPLRRLLQKVHPILFHAAAAKDVLHQRGKTIDVTFGDPDSPEMTEALKDISTAPEKVRDFVINRLPEMA